MKLRKGRRKDGRKYVLNERTLNEVREFLKKIRKEYKIEKNETGETKRRKDF